MDDNSKQGDVLGVKVVKPNYENLTHNTMCVSIGNNEIRKEVSEKYNSHFPSFVHSSAHMYPSANIGEGTLVHPQAIIDAAVDIKDFCIINNNATISHNVLIDSFVHVAIQASIAGGVTIGEGTLIGAGSVILPEINIGKWAVVGAGAIVTKDVPDYAIVMGNPGELKGYRK
jgi:sugar O-acyltransferase (sialic acid O-acetyltransferase NeuD family)